MNPGDVPTHSIQCPSPVETSIPAGLDRLPTKCPPKSFDAQPTAPASYAAPGQGGEAGADGWAFNERGVL